MAPPRKNLLLVSNGLLAKVGLWQARRLGTAERLDQLGTEKTAGGTTGRMLVPLRTPLASWPPAGRSQQQTHAARGELLGPDRRPGT
jgi:hypothetical protein